MPPIARMFHDDDALHVRFRALFLALIVYSYNNEVITRRAACSRVLGIIILCTFNMTARDRQHICSYWTIFLYLILDRLFIRDMYATM